MGRAGGLGGVVARAVVAIEVEEEGRFPNRPYGNDGWERYAAVGMTCGEVEGMTRRGGSFICLIRFRGFVPGVDSIWQSNRGEFD